MRELGSVNRLEQVDGARAPLRQAGSAHLDAIVPHALVLAVQRQVIQELVGQHAGQQAYVRHAALQHVGRCRHRVQGLGVAALANLAHVLQHGVTAGALRQPPGDLLADDFDLVVRDTL